MPGGEPFQRLAVLVHALAFQHQQRRAGLGVQQLGQGRVGGDGADLVAARAGAQAEALGQHTMQRSIGQVLSAQAGHGGGGQPGAHIGQRRLGHVAQPFQQQQVGRAEEIGHGLGRLTCAERQHAGLERHAGLGELLVEAGGPLHQPAMFLRRGHHGGAARFALDQAFGRQRRQRLPHHAARHAKTLAQRGLAGQQRAGIELAGADVAAQQRGHLGMQRHLARAVERGQIVSGGGRHGINLLFEPAQFPIHASSPGPDARRARRPGSDCLRGQCPGRRCRTQCRGPRTRAPRAGRR